MRVHTALALVLVSTPAAGLAQEMRMAHGPDGSVASVRQLYDMTKGWLIRSAENMPETEYAFQPTPEVRSFGQLIGHVANANYLFCSTVKAEKNPSTADFEKTTSKADLVKAIKDAFGYCDGAYQMSDTKANTEQVTFFGSMTGSRLWALMFNVAHNSEHYGNLVTYFRLKGMVPPSSQGGM
ncbi:MAG TPA: DinB family protein [Gemmatimonadales bacterium]|nr:DinB family protein [Gemmatimonadales bacterium]